MGRGISPGAEERKATVTFAASATTTVDLWLRGAEVDNNSPLEKDFPGAKVIKLERNYRSTEHILGAGRI